MTRLQDSLEENVLTLLCWSEQHAARVALQATPDLFSTREFRRIAEEAHAHLGRYGQPPGVHLRDILEKRLRKGEEGQLLRQTIDAMERVQAELQPEFVLESLDRFISLRQMTMAVESAAEALNNGELEKAQEALNKPDLAPKATAGIWLNKPEQALTFLDRDDGDFFSSGIDVLDDLGIRPMRGTETVMIASAKSGKSWWLTEVGKRGLLHHRKVLHISLENGEERTAQRYVQSLYAMASDEKHGALRIPRFTRDSLGRCLSIEHDNLSPEVIDAAAKPLLGRKLSAIHGRLLIKEFPTASLTMGQYNAYLDMLARTEGFVPDLVLFDYPDLCAMGSETLRTDTGRIFRQLRGIAQQRNHALVTVTQGNRSSGAARTVTTSMVAEDWSKIGTADTVLTYSQTSEERELGLARILVAAARDARDKYVVMISQSYATGQFALDSVYMSKFLESEVDRMTGKTREDTD